MNRNATPSDAVRGRGTRISPSTGNQAPRVIANNDMSGLLSTSAGSSRGETGLLSPDIGYNAIDPRSRASTPSASDASTDDECDLCTEISDMMEENKIGIHNEEGSPCLPDGERQRLINKDSISKALKVSKSSGLVRWIHEKASKTFAITVQVFPGPVMPLLVKEAMEGFMAHGFTDGDLPVPDLTAICGKNIGSLSSERCCGSKSRPPSCEGLHKTRFKCFHHKTWKSNSLRTFRDKQWGLLLHIFDTKRIEHDPIESQRILPFLHSEKDIRAKNGKFAEVRYARLLKSFHEPVKNSDGDIVDVAIKEFREGDSTYNIEIEWRKEIKAHEELDRLNKDHIVQALAAFKHGEKYYIVFEWADGGDLRSYWRKNEPPRLTPHVILSFLEQLCGLLQALNTMHHPDRSGSQVTSQRNPRQSTAAASPPPSRDESTYFGREYMLSGEAEDMDTIHNASRTSTNPRINIEDSSETRATTSGTGTREFGQPGRRLTIFEENWRHGDIKPDNILRFPGSALFGDFKLADLGRTAQNFLNTADQPQVVWDRWRSLPYEPPDFHITPDRGMSRLFDVWSLGCVFFEFLVWLLYGKDWLKDFVKTQQVTGIDETPFWKRVGTSQSATISPVVKACIDHILLHDPECNARIGTALKDLLVIVKTKMLVIGLPDRMENFVDGTRANTHVLLAELKNILNRAKDPSYLFIGGDRTNVGLLPELATSAGSRSSGTLEVNGFDDSKGRSNNMLTVPRGSIHAMSKTQRARAYTDILEDKWSYDNDDSFARKMYTQNVTLHCPNSMPASANRKLCEFCRSPNILHSDRWRGRKVENLDKQCALCTLLLTHVHAGNWDKLDTILLTVTDTGVVISSPGNSNNVDVHLRLCKPPDSAANSIPSIAFVPLGLPRLPDDGSDASFDILQSWLRDCDKGHEGKKLDCLSRKSKKHLPKRLLDVGISKHETHCRIVNTKSLKENAGTDYNVAYFALSHPWGPQSAIEPHWVTTINTLNQYMKRLPDDTLPQNFRDAVKVTRALGVRYLWIDALCILQRTPSHAGDFQDEAGLMQDIFSSAYCVLAAPSATEMNCGFLHSGAQTLRNKRQAVEVLVGRQEDRLFVCDSPDDFQHDVIDSPLNSRAWVLQERALARRTIYFTNNQIYWECSGGVRCETMSKLANPEVAFLGDSNFPAYVVEKTKGAQISLFQGLYEAFCQLGLSHITDKPFAISGLEQRLTERLEDVSAAGVFGKHRGRCLLWRRAEDMETLKRITFPTTGATTGAHKPPSWSFMAYSGAISYIEVPGDSTAWQDLNLRLTGTGEKSWLYANDPLAFNTRAFDFEIALPRNDDLWLVSYDIPTEPRKDDKCVIIGKRGEILRYILVVRPESQEGASRARYRRAGAGYIPFGWIKSHSLAVEIV